MAQSGAQGPMRPGGDAGEGDGNRGETAVVGQAPGGSDEGGIGLLLPLILGATLAGAVAVAVLRRRRRADPSE